MNLGLCTLRCRQSTALESEEAFCYDPYAFFIALGPKPPPSPPSFHSLIALFPHLPILQSTPHKTCHRLHKLVWITDLAPNPFPQFPCLLRHCFTLPRLTLLTLPTYPCATSISALPQDLHQPTALFFFFFMGASPQIPKPRSARGTSICLNAHNLPPPLSISSPPSQCLQLIHPHLPCALSSPLSYFSTTLAANFCTLFASSSYSTYRRVLSYYSDDPTGRSSTGEDAFDMRKPLKRDKKKKYIRENGEDFRITPEEMYGG